MRAKIRCKKCKYTFEAELQVSQIGPLKPDSQSKASKIKLDKDSLDKLSEVCKGASREELEKIGLKIEPSEWAEAQERLTLKRFILDNLKICKERKSQKGEKYVVSTEPWTMGDSFRDVDLASSETKSLGVDDLRLIPGVTLQKKVYGVTKGRDTEELKGIKFLVILDGSGSMIVTSSSWQNQGKIGKALLIGKDIYQLTKRLGFDYLLTLFSDSAQRVEKRDLEDFWREASFRATYKIWNGGTKLQTALASFTDEEYRDGNVVIISDMDIADFEASQERILEISRLTNSFKIVLVENLAWGSLGNRVKQVEGLFPDSNVKILLIVVESTE